MAQPIKKGVVFFAATVAIVFGLSALSTTYSRATKGGSEAVSESFDMKGVSVVEINTQSYDFNVEFSNDSTNRATLKMPQSDYNSSTQLTGHIDNGVLKITGMGGIYQSMLRLPNSVREIRLTGTDSSAELSIRAAEKGTSIANLSIRAQSGNRVSISSLNVDKLSVDWPVNVGDNNPQLSLYSNRIKNLRIHMPSGDIDLNGTTASPDQIPMTFEKAQLMLGETVRLSGITAQMLQKTSIAKFEQK